MTSHSKYNAANRISEVYNKISDFDIFSGLEIVVPKAKGLREEINKYRKKVAVLLVHGGDREIDREALSDSRVDILAHPGEIDQVMAKLACENGVALDFNLGAVINLRGNPRAQAISSMRGSLRLAKKYRVPMVLTSNALSHYDLRAPREMVALAMLFGMSMGEAISALSTTPRNILQRRRLGFVMEGVEVVR